MELYKIKKEDAEIIRNKMKEIKDAKIYKRLQAVALRGEGQKRVEVANITGYSNQRISILCKKYIEEGLESLLEDGRKGGNHRNMNEEEAREFLGQFKEMADKGQVVSINEISKEYDAVTKKERSSKSTVYYFLQRQGWRTVMPRSGHPNKASDEVIEASKKLT